MNTTTHLTLTLAMTLGLAAPARAGDAKVPATPTAAARKAPGTTTAPATEPRAEKPAPPRPPQEIADYVKVMGGTWKCAGKAAMNPADMTVMTDVKMTLAMKLDLDKWWIAGTLTSPAPMKMRGQLFATYDPSMKKWYRTMVDTMGASESTWSDGLKDGKVVWLGEGRGMGMGAFKIRTTETMVGPKEVTMTGEMSMDGRTWMTGWTATCKK